MRHLLKIVFALYVSSSTGMVSCDMSLQQKLGDAIQEKNTQVINELLSLEAVQKFSPLIKNSFFIDSVGIDSSRSIPHLLFNNGFCEKGEGLCLYVLRCSLGIEGIDTEQTLQLMECLIEKGHGGGNLFNTSLISRFVAYRRINAALKLYQMLSNKTVLDKSDIATIHGWQLIEVVKRGNFKKLVSFYHDHKNSLDINATDEQGTALLYAVKQGNYACAKLLMQSGADIHEYSPISLESIFIVAKVRKDRSKEHRKIYKLIA